jgi:hypothetical protein
VNAAQALLDAQVRTSWRQLCERVLQRVHPTHQELFGKVPLHYYWSIAESEWASDVMVRSPSRLAALYPRLLRHGVENLRSVEVMRFLGHKLPTHGYVHGNFADEVVTDLHRRPEGVRLKHRVGRNSIKMYDKQGSVLRVETTLNDVQAFKAYRAPEGRPRAAKRWRPLRKGAADLWRRVQVSQAANQRYLQSLAAVDEPRALQDLTAKLCRPVQWHGQRLRGLNPLGTEDAALLGAVMDGQFTIHGCRNRDLRALLYGRRPASPTCARQQAAKITRQLRLLRAHGLIRKVPRTHRYTLTDFGHKAITALLNARRADAATLLQLAA